MKVIAVFFEQKTVTESAFELTNDIFGANKFSSRTENPTESDILIREALKGCGLIHLQGYSL